MEENRTRSSAAGEKRRTWGFTLVELIIVIAILAVLAGVAYPVYTGYITKANEAADLALLGQVNESFTSALYDVGYNDGLPEAAEATLTEKKLSEVSSDGIDGLNEAFMKYFAGNENTEFKVYTGLGYDRTLGGFYGKLSDGTIALSNGWKMKPKDNGNGTVTYTVTDDEGNEYEYTLNNTSMEAYSASTFGQNMTASGLMKDIDNVAETFANFMKPPSPFSSYASKFADALGVSLDANDPDYYKKLGNAMVLGVADASFDGGFDAKSIADAWTTKYSVSLDTKNLNNTAAQLALGYALATGFANSEIGKTQEFNFGGETMTAAEYYKQQTATFSGKTGFDALQAIQTMLGTMIESDGYRKYYAAAGEADIEGYLGALDAIKNNRDTLESGNNVVNNAEGFADDDLGAILDALFGSGN